MIIKEQILALARSALKEHTPSSYRSKVAAVPSRREGMGDRSKRGVPNTRTLVVMARGEDAHAHLLNLLGAFLLHLCLHRQNLSTWGMGGPPQEV